MVKILFDKNAKDVKVISDVISLDKAKEIAEGMKQKAFGVFSGIVKAFSKEKVDIQLTGHIKRYRPFWYLKGESEFEYKRNTNYAFEVRPEVRFVTVNGKVMKVDEESPTVHLVGEDHCFEFFDKEIIHSGLDQKEKNLAKYMEFDSKKITALPKAKDTVIESLQIRASYLINTLIKEVVKPIHADKIISEKVTINKLTLYYRPYWVFEFQEPSTNKKRHIEVDAVTGEAAKVEKLFGGEPIHRKIFSEANLFDITAEIAGNIVPGAGIGLVVGKAVRDKRAKSKTIKKYQENLEAYKLKKGGGTK